MASTTSNKAPATKNVIYDSRNDTSTGRKRAVDFVGGVSVAERARLFGPQITHAIVPKNPPTQRPPGNKPPIKPNVVEQERIANRQFRHDSGPSERVARTSPERTSNDYRRFQQDSGPTERVIRSSSPERASNNYRRFRQDSGPTERVIRSSSPERTSNNHRRFRHDSGPTERGNRTSSPPEKVSNNYRPKREPPPSSTSQHYSTVKRSPTRHQQQSTTTYDTFRSKPKKKRPSNRRNYTQIIPGDSYPYKNDLYVTQQPLPRDPNYFHPIQDPLQALYRDSAQAYPQQQMPMAANRNDMNGMHAFDLGNLIHQIQDDYLNNVRPYVSSVQFIENEQSLANIGGINPLTGRKDYSRQNNNLYLRPGASYNYDIIDTNDLYPTYTRPIYHDNHYSSPRRKRRRRKHRERYHDQASSPIHVFESSTKAKRRESSPSTPVPQTPTPVAASLSEAEENEVTANTKTEEVETSESEDESTEDVKPLAEPIPAVTSTEITRPTLPNPTPITPARVPAQPVASESSESGESDSDSDSDSDDEEDEKPKPNPLSPASRFNNTRTAPVTPQTNTRVLPQRTTTGNTTDVNQPPEAGSTRSFNLETPKKSGIAGRFQSLFNKIRRRKPHE